MNYERGRIMEKEKNHNIIKHTEPRGCEVKDKLQSTKKHLQIGNESSYQRDMMTSSFFLK